MRRLHRLAAASLPIAFVLFGSTGTPALAGGPSTAATTSTVPSGDKLCSTTGAPQFRLDLAGVWKFTEGDNASWSSPGFNDSSWENRWVPDDWNKTAQSNYDGFAWYRRSFKLPERPARLTDSAIVAAMGYIDDADATYLNGTLIGKTGGFPPNFDSAWDEPRQYYPPDGLLKWGHRNVVAIRMYDGTGGGGFYKGPIGLFSKASLRAEQGLITTNATKAEIRLACNTLETQHRALGETALINDGAARRQYMRTLDDGFLHSGDDLARRRGEIRQMLATYRSVRLVDAQTEVVVDSAGRIVVDTLRSWTGVKANGHTLVIYPPTRQFLYIDPHTGLELGDHARMFRDSYVSNAMGGVENFDVYLPPSYVKTSVHRYPVVYMLHGVNGSNIEWEVRDMRTRMDKLILNHGIAETIVIFPDGSSGWWVNSSAGNYRTMLVKELVPLVDRLYRTIPDRDHRGITGVSMGGHGSWSIGLEHPELFSSIASHMGALDFPALAGTSQDMARNAKYTPLAMVDAMTPQQLRQHTYYFDAGEDDDYRFDDAARAMDKELTAKGVPHEWQIGPGRHADSYWVPKLRFSFGLHTRQFKAHPYHQLPEPRDEPGANWPWH